MSETSSVVTPDTFNSAPSKMLSYPGMPLGGLSLRTRNPAKSPDEDPGGAEGTPRIPPFFENNISTFDAVRHFAETSTQTAKCLGHVWTTRENQLTELGAGSFGTVFMVEDRSGTVAAKPLNAPTQLELDTVAPLGITQENRAPVSRAVGMYELGRMFGWDVIPETWGGLMEMHGRPNIAILQDMVYGVHAAGPSQTGTSLSAKDPVYQRESTKLQLLDQIAGYPDRHRQNYICGMTPDGAVKSVKGIDNEWAFGATSRTIGAPPADAFAEQLLDDPPVIDSEMASTIQNADVGKIASLLSKAGLASAEIDATLLRLDDLKFSIENGEIEIISPQQWGADEVTGKLRRWNAIARRDGDSRGILFQETAAEKEQREEMMCESAEFIPDQRS